MKGKGLHCVTFILLVVGGLNWLLVGVFGWDLGELLFGGQSAAISRIIYVLVGIAAILAIVNHKKECKMCDKTNMPAQ